MRQAGTLGDGIRPSTPPPPTILTDPRSRRPAKAFRRRPARRRAR